MKTLSTIVALTVAASSLSINMSAQASNITLKAVNDNTETLACYIAATKGLDSAKSFIRSEGYQYPSFQTALTCNGMSIADFADEYAVKANAQQQPALKSVRLMAKDQASQLCVDAVVLGEAKAREKYNAQGEVILCNHKPIRQFVRSFSDKKIIDKSVFTFAVTEQSRP